MSKRRRHKGFASAFGAIVLGLLAAGEAWSRPAYFEQFTDHYGFVEGDRLFACGVCHFRWTGTGSRNAYGTSVEQQLYTGKTILDSLLDVESADPDGDGFTSGDELMNWLTLPGYNCETYTQANLAPTDIHEYIEPMVATCLDPHDIRVTPSSLGSLLTVDEVDTMEVTVLNNGSTNPLEVTSYAFLPGAPAALTVSGPVAPFIIPVGGSQILTVTFAPTSVLLSASTLRIVSDDPDELNTDIPVTVAAFADPTAPGAQRGPCFESMAKAMSKYAKTHLKVWGDCYLEELSGRACDTGARDVKIARAATKVASVVGGDKDRTCEAAGLTATTLGFPGVCAEGCVHLTIGDVDDIPACLTCMQDRVMEGVLRDGAGTAPPDLPPNVITIPDALKCQSMLLRATQKALLSMYKQLNACELTAMLADEPGGACLASLSSVFADVRQTVDNVADDKCTDSTDLLGCLYEGMSPDPECLGLSAEQLASDLTDTTFALFE